MRMEHADLTEKIIGCAMRVHSTLGPGYLESVYENALAHELRRSGIRLECQKPIVVMYDGIVVGDFFADMLVESAVIVENKAVHALCQAHELQLVNYLTATGVELGLLFNFGTARLEFKRKHRTYQPSRRKKNGADPDDSSGPGGAAPTK